MDSIFRDAYFAGLIDGEGSIYLKKKGKNGIRPMVQLRMTCEKTVMALRDHFDCGTVFSEPHRGENRKPTWQWQTSYHGARMVVRRILPFLITKRENAELLLQHVPKWKRTPQKDAL